MNSKNVYRRNRYMAPIAEKNADELLLAIKKGQTDADECRAELHRQGWTDAHIEQQIGA